MRTAARDNTLSEESRAFLSKRIESYDGSVLTADALIGSYKRRKETHRSQQDSRSRVMAKSLNVLTLPKWPPTGSGRTKQNPEEVDHSLLIFISQLLEWSSDPLLSEAMKHKKLKSCISDASIRECVSQCCTFALSISWLLATFQPDKSALYRVSKSISRLGSPLGAQDERKELSNLIRVQNLKFKLLRGHKILEIINTCKNNPSPSLLLEIGRKIKSESFLGSLILDSVYVMKPTTLLDDADVPEDSDEFKIKEQHRIMLSYNFNKELFVSFNKRCLTPRTQIDFQIKASNLNVDLNQDSEFINFFWFFTSVQLKHLSSTSAGLRTKLEMQANTTKHPTNYFHEVTSSSSEVEEDIVNFVGKSPKKKNLKKKQPKKSPTSSQNMSTEGNDFLWCPIKEHHGKHRPYSCADFLKLGVKGAIQNKICPVCLVQPLSSQHSNQCKPVLTRQKGGKREQIPLFCKKCPKIGLTNQNISCYQNNKLCGCGKKKLDKINYVPTASTKSSPKIRRSKGKTNHPAKDAKSKGRRNSKSKIREKSLNILTDEGSEVEHETDNEEQ